jgi:DNA-binding protein H-NS
LADDHGELFFLQWLACARAMLHSLSKFRQSIRN